MSWRRDRLPELVRAMAGRPRHEALRETVAPFRLLDTVTAVIPLDGARLLDADAAAEAGHRHLAAWLRDAEAKWAEHGNRGSDGQPRMALRARLDHMRNLSAQAGRPAIRVLYTKAGTRLRAARAEAVAALVPLEAAQHFTAHRRAIRDALAADGVAAEIEALVDALLPP